MTLTYKSWPGVRTGAELNFRLIYIIQTNVILIDQKV